MSLSAAPDVQSPSKKPKPAFAAGLYVAGEEAGYAIDDDERRSLLIESRPPAAAAIASNTADGRSSPASAASPHSQNNTKDNDRSYCSVSLESADSNNNNVEQESGSDADHSAREREGLCLSCGKQLYKIKTKKKGIFKQSKKEVKVPLSIPGEVERGQCLQCCTQQEGGTGARHGIAAATEGGGDVSPSSSVTDCDSLRVEQQQQRGAHHRNPSSLPAEILSSNAVYEGSFNVYGERDGKGTMTWENGDEYKGDFFNGNRHGHGTLTFADGSEYVGEWECNQQHGVGTRRWNNGDVYTGQYKKGKRTGEGRFYFANGDLYTGHWENGVMQGFGRYYYSSGQRFEGDFEQGLRRGKGKLQRVDGTLDIGVYFNDVRIGVGVRWSADRTSAWKLQGGQVKKKITIPEAVALDYDIDAAVEALDAEGVV